MPNLGGRAISGEDIATLIHLTGKEREQFYIALKFHAIDSLSQFGGTGE